MTDLEKLTNLIQEFGLKAGSDYSIETRSNHTEVSLHAESYHGFTEGVKFSFCRGIFERFHTRDI